MVGPGFYEEHLDTNIVVGVPHDSADGYMFDFAINMAVLKYLQAISALNFEKSLRVTEYMRSSGSCQNVFTRIRSSEPVRGCLLTISISHFSSDATVRVHGGGRVVQDVPARRRTLPLVHFDLDLTIVFSPFECAMVFLLRIPMTWLATVQGHGVCRGGAARLPGIRVGRGRLRVCGRRQQNRGLDHFSAKQKHGTLRGHDADHVLQESAERAYTTEPH